MRTGPRLFVRLLNLAEHFGVEDRSCLGFLLARLRLLVTSLLLVEAVLDQAFVVERDGVLFVEFLAPGGCGRG